MSDPAAAPTTSLSSTSSSSTAVPERALSRASRRRTRTRDRLLAAAEEAFRASAFRDVRMEDLAEAADVSVGTIYGHFGSKDGLWLAVAEQAVARFRRYLDEAFRPDATALEQVMAAGDSYLRFHLEQPGSFRFLAFGAGAGPIDAAGPGSVDGHLDDGVGARLEDLISDFQSRIQRALDDGEIAPGLDARLAARFLWGAWNGVVSFSLRADRMRLSDDDIAACLQQGRRIVLDGLGAAGNRDDAGRTRARLLDTGGV